MAHKRIIDAVSDKANALIQVSQAPLNVQDKVQSVKQRYEKLVDTSLKGVQNLEALSDVFQQFYDLQKVYKDYQKQQWDKLNNYNDYSGNKAALQARLLKLIEIQDNLSEGEVKLEVLEEHVTKSAEIVSPRSQETMERDLNNLRL